MILPYFSSLIIIIFLSIFIFTREASAAAAPFFYGVTPDLNTVDIVDPPTPCELPATCDNTAVPGEPNQCGATCPTDESGSKGNSWTKYALTCYKGKFSGELRGAYQIDSPVCAIGDKCHAGEIGLHYGSCTCGVEGPSIYKYCCTTQGNPEACNTNAVQDNFPPPEGQCPGGYIVDGSRVRDSSCVPLVTCEPDPANKYNQCGQTGGCTNNYAASHTVEITPSSCSDGSTGPPYTCSDLGQIVGPCYTPPPTLNPFTISPTCPRESTTLSWSGSPLPSADPGCPNGFWVDIDETSSFSSFSNKCVQGTTLTTDGTGFNAAGDFTFNPGTTYWARVYNGSHSNSQSATAPAQSCGAVTVPIGGRVTDCSSGAAIPNVPVTVYDSTLSTNNTRTINTVADGSFSTSTSGDFVRSADAYAVRAPTPPQTFNSISYSSRSPSTNFENQVAGGSPSCGTNCHFCYSTAAVIPDYSLSNSGNITVTSPSSGSATGTNTITKTLLQGTVGAVTLSLSTTLPSGVTYSFANNPCTPTCSSTFTVNVPSTAAAGTYPITVVGSVSGLPNKPTNFNLIIITSGTPNCTISVTPNPDGQSSPGIWNPVTVNTTSNSMNGGFVYFYNPGVYPPGCSGPSCSDGWTFLTGYSLDGNHSTSLSSTTLGNLVPASGGTYTFGMTDSNNILKCVNNETFNPTVGPAPPPPSSGPCTVTASPSTVPPGNTVSVTITGTAGTYYLTCPDDSTRGPGDLSSSWMCSTPDTPGTYTIYARSGVISCSTNVNLQTSEADCRDRERGTIIGYAFNDLTYAPTQWPAYAWNKWNDYTCWNYSNPYGSLPQSSTLAQSNLNQGEVLAATSCSVNSDCNDNKACTTDSCQNVCVAWGDYGACTQYAKQCSNSNVAYGTSCGTSSTGGNMYCGGNYSTRVGDGICYDTLCKVSSECGNDGNICTTEQCNGYQPESNDPYSGSSPEILGTCYPSFRASATICGASPTGGDKYCDATGNCLDTLCKTNSDCGNDNNLCTKDICSGYYPAGSDGYSSWPENLGTCYPPEPNGFSCGTSPNGGTMYCDGNKVCSDELCKAYGPTPECNDSNSCTNDSCSGYQPASGGDEYNPPQPERAGTCQHPNITPYSVCSTNPDGSSAKLCSYEPTSTSQCNVDYVSCTNPTQNDQNCCGLTNIQGKQCQGSCYVAAYPAYYPPTLNPQTPAKAGIIVHADGNRCNLNYTTTTDSNGYAYFSSIPGLVGSNAETANQVKYTLWAEIPSDGQTQFTRGTCYYYLGWKGPYPDSVFTVTNSGNNRATCNRYLRPTDTRTGFSSFGFSQILPAWIQTTGGDVHSNTNINTPGGP